MQDLMKVSLELLKEQLKQAESQKAEKAELLEEEKLETKDLKPKWNVGCDANLEKNGNGRYLVCLSGMKQYL